MNIINKYIGNYAKDFENKVSEKIADSLSDMYKISTTNRLDEFRSKLSSNGGVALDNRFIFALEIPNIIKKKDNVLSLLGITKFDEELALLGCKVSVGGRKIATKDVSFYNGITRKVPTSYTDNTLTVTYIERNDRYIYKLFSEWMNNIVDPMTNCGHFFNDVAVDARLLYYDKKDLCPAFVNFQEVIPVEMSLPDSDWSSDEYTKIDIKFAFTYQYNESFYLQSLLDSIGNVEYSDLIQTIW